MPSLDKIQAAQPGTDQRSVSKWLELLHRRRVRHNSVVWNRLYTCNSLIAFVLTLSYHTEPRFLTPQHDFTRKPLQFFWMDLISMADLFNIPQEDAVLLTQVQSDSDPNEDGKLPIRPPKDSVGNFKTTPLIHTGYAATWFGLSGAGVYMTRMLMKGRGW